MPSRSQRDDPESVRAEVRRDRAVFAAGEAYVRTHAAGEAEGLFGPGSVAWRIFREPSVLLGAVRAIALQMAHPAVATGVEAHSNFKSDVLGRARRTYTTLYHLVFGDLDQAVAAARRLHGLHRGVRGHVEWDVDAPSAGAYYRANDPDLLLWVQATLVDTVMVVYEHLIRPLTPEEKRQFYRESRLTAVVLGIPPEHYPASLKDFYRYYEGMLESPALAVGRAGWNQVEALVTWPYLPSSIGRTFTAGLLPPRFRAAYGLPWDTAQERRFHRLVGGLRALLRITPSALRAVPAYHQARLRLARTRGERASLPARALDRLARAVPLPLSIRPIG